ncbi:phosphoenolpyruvate phosphomutase-domain-containing protein [Mariannaea sp. PMI_226]|nr:phosphoenolpyruvate phosphomutase-domain-containing protein [Mariannaea sp. PMI_226]
MASINDTAKKLKALHVPSSPIVFANVWDISSFNTVVSLNDGGSNLVKAIATASYAIAASSGTQDEKLTIEENFQAITKIAPLAKAAGLPLSTDLQDGYGDQIAAVVKKAIELGAVGANIEDSILGTDKLRPIDEQVQRYKTALKAAADAGCPDFVLNARSDIFHFGPGGEAVLEEAIARGKAYLEAGATTVFYWGGPGRGLRTAWVERLVKELDGRVAVILGPMPGLETVNSLAKIGVARISVGPSLYRLATITIQEAARKLLSGGGLI